MTKRSACNKNRNNLVCHNKDCTLKYQSLEASINIWNCKQCSNNICDICFKKRSWKIGNGFNEAYFKHCSSSCADKTILSPFITQK